MLNRNPFLSSNRHVPHTFSHTPPKSSDSSPSSQQNTLKALIRGQITGKSFKSVRHLSPVFFSHLNKPFNSLATLVVELEDSLAFRDSSKCETCLLALSRKISELTSAFFHENRDWIIQLHGHELLVRILEFPLHTNNNNNNTTNNNTNNNTTNSNTNTNNNNTKSNNSNTYSSTNNDNNNNSTQRPPRRLARSSSGQIDPRVRKIRNQSMVILRELCFTHPTVGEWLSENNRLITFLFALLADERTFDAAIGLLEEILGAKEDTFDLSLVPGLNMLVRGMTDSQLGIFCRVLAMVVFEPDDRNGDEIVSSLELLKSRKKGRYVTPAIRNIDRNHAIVLGIPRLLERLVKLLGGTNDNDQPSFAQLLAAHLTHGVGAVLHAAEAHTDGEDEEVEVEEAEEGDEEEGDADGEEGDQADEEEMVDVEEEGDAMETDGAHAPQGANAGGLAGIAGMLEGMLGAMGGAGNAANAGRAPGALGGLGLFNMDHELQAIMDGTAQTLKDLALSTYQVELLFVLYALLAGKRKAEIQDRLASLGLITTATTLFDKTDWLKAPAPITHAPAPHGPQCECNPDSALKIQLLRLILNFCDGDFENRHNKLLLLSLEELRGLYSGNTLAAQLSSAAHFERSAVSGPGLLSKLINVFYKLPQDQNNRFWMASCIEAFLRGSEPVFQKFVAKSGMLAYLVDDIVSDTPKVQGSMQTSFDLLGELMKFNREIFASFNEIVVGEKLTKFFNNVNTHLVDSNVFLRGMVLSMERFAEQDQNPEKFQNSPAQPDAANSQKSPAHTPYPHATCKISQFLQENWFRLVKDLMTVVSIDAVNQENICCVNTTMVFCIYARRKGQLRPFVASVREEEQAFKKTLNQTTLVGGVTNNFQKLLWFWHEYYLLRGKDCLSLEYTSQIPFSEWTATYEVLVEELGEFDPTELYDKTTTKTKTKMDM